MATPADVDRLFTVPPRDFIRARNEVAKALRDRGEAAEERRVAHLPKPSPALWAVNQAARRSADDVAALTAAIDRVQRGREVGAAVNDQRAALARVMGAADAALRDASMASSPAVTRRISATLLGAALDPQAREAMQHGRLTREYSAPGIEALTAVSGADRDGGHAVRDRASARTPSVTEERRRATDRQQEAERARAARAAEAEARASRRQAEDLERQAARRRRTASALERKIRTVRQTLERLEQRLRDEQTSADELSAAGVKARQAVVHAALGAEARQRS
jgi:hypothetical protein